MEQKHTDREILDAYETVGSKLGAAKLLKVDERGYRRRLNKLLTSDHVPLGHHLRGVSTLEDEDGNIKQRWIKTKQGHTDIESIKKYFDTKKWKPAPSIKVPVKTKKDLLTLYTITDYHVGQYSWQEEVGADWDTDIAETVAIKSIINMISGSPDSEIAILNIQGDFLHWDGLLAVTPMHKHILDADTRYPKIIKVADRIIESFVELLLKKHKRVIVYILEGNHDESGSIWMRHSIWKSYRNNKRAYVDQTVSPYAAYLHGKVMLGFHHGHKRKGKALAGIFSAKYRDMWGKANNTYIHTGHYHHVEKQISEGEGAIIEQHPTLAANDSHSSRLGYQSRRAAYAITYHKETGEYLRVTVYP